jgi:hypothetical protein
MAARFKLGILKDRRFPRPFSRATHIRDLAIPAISHTLGDADAVLTKSLTGLVMPASRVAVIQDSVNAHCIQRRMVSSSQLRAGNRIGNERKDEPQ